MTDLQWRRLIEDWVRDHGRDVRAFLCHRLGNSLQVDDLVQETFCRCWERRASIPRLDRPKAFLIKIAHRLMIDHYRDQKRQTKLHDRIAHQTPIAQEAGQQMVWDETTRQVHESLQQLREEYREVLLLRYYGELSFQEIAELTKRPLGTVLSYAQRGLNELRTHAVELFT